ncbi:dihydrofolate reductase family protein [Nocardioides sp. zg-1230]|uniref:dihydrofolate reductase family protein n=1 Tax=Nocardioides sp. zg-1230 TaxID=2736601 RepID=UPI0015559050|nr:dihydrofolate reductase family protein [Nocardioides sp. zg-1230]NPC44140.1 dihydrofolate reductase [Nocardioides sp. zg-1230]
MRKLIAIEFLSVDGVMQGLGSPDEDRSGGFKHGGWGARFADAIHTTSGRNGLAGTSAYLFGRRTYEKMAAFWPHQPDTNLMAAHLNGTPKHVASSTLDYNDVTWDNTTVMTGDLASNVRRLKSTGTGDLVILGSGVVVRHLLRQDLIDGLRLYVHPLVLGSGTRLFGELPSPLSLKLTGCDTTSLGSIVLTYDIDHDGDA